jgi:hypothetical protein
MSAALIFYILFSRDFLNDAYKKIETIDFFIHLFCIY